MLVYDITNDKSFENIKNWIRNIEEVSKFYHTLILYMYIYMLRNKVIVCFLLFLFQESPCIVNVVLFSF